MKYIFYFSIVVIFSRCTSVKSYNVVIKKNINSQFVLGTEQYEKHYGLWHLKYIISADDTLKTEETRYYSLAFKNPTDIGLNRNFIIVKNEQRKEQPKYMIVKIKNDSLIRYYSAKNEKKFLELRKKLNVPDSLNFINLD